MTDTTLFFRNVAARVADFINTLDDVKLLADMIATDSFLSGQAATAAQASNRKDLTAADFDNFNAAVQLLTTTLNSINPSVNTGGAVKLAFYKMK